MTSEISGHASAHTMLLEIADAAGIERGAAFTADEIVRRLMALGAETAATAIEELAAEITRLRSLLKDREWRDISTAPKDGTLILAVDRNGWREMWWVTNGTDYADYWQDHYDSEPEPTHWLPLPLPPQPEKEKT